MCLAALFQLREADKASGERVLGRAGLARVAWGVRGGRDQDIGTLGGRNQDIGILGCRGPRYRDTGRQGLGYRDTGVQETRI